MNIPCTAPACIRLHTGPPHYGMLLVLTSLSLPGLSLYKVYVLQLFNNKPHLLFMCRCRQSALTTSYAKKLRGQESAALVRHTEKLGKQRRGQYANERGCRIQAEQQKRPEVCNRADAMFLIMIAYSKLPYGMQSAQIAASKIVSLPFCFHRTAACAMAALSCMVLHSSLCAQKNSLIQITGHHVESCIGLLGHSNGRTLAAVCTSSSAYL